ncbi:hypothetical protein CROQUDRAFT_368019 [Cronartium quercuum f. sp. fusiforme G11]|uniref:Uncharacterized protein n=1 Tax=Cronartium quercuum f. sp. fusiforme G11 TaxID=708437 RepID=A0A9P6N699_9BASI|nr:hypothetical protein CROQUDRAFT_368019 [Cronartium quercuum f. sp. fusiforme G11]
MRMRFWKTDATAKASSEAEAYRKPDLNKVQAFRKESARQERRRLRDCDERWEVESDKDEDRNGAAALLNFFKGI